MNLNRRPPVAQSVDTPSIWVAGGSGFESREDCQNYIRILAKTGLGKLLLCGTNSFKPICRDYSVQVRPCHTYLPSTLAAQGWQVVKAVHDKCDEYLGQYHERSDRPHHKFSTWLDPRCWTRDNSGAVVTERLACSPPTRANRFQSPADSLPGFRNWESCGTMPLVGGFSRGSPVSPARCFLALFHSHLISPLLVLNTSLLRAAQLSQLNS
ncbi:hypothetical protein PR048_017927 [Dryococelus australis]|uniref:Uncharacterized protein n=1 Tax=Dryococelus australis TaxID=614101 RepID=A0ABQ9HAV4_9NEOP|nr:hypothetical protein PR048_017927 [Dryococelus australis]